MAIKAKVDDVFRKLMKLMEIEVEEPRIILEPIKYSIHKVQQDFGETKKSRKRKAVENGHDLGDSNAKSSYVEQEKKEKPESNANSEEIVEVKEENNIEKHGSKNEVTNVQKTEQEEKLDETKPESLLETY